MKGRILIIYTGGTIGMRQSAQGYVPGVGFKQLMQTQLGQALLNRLPVFDLIEFEQLIDSANLTPDHWVSIAQPIIDNWSQYDGFVVIHGTDTMAYTAAALSFMLQNIDKPVIVTGSQIPLLELRNDGQNNLMTAMMLAGEYLIPEVCLYFNGKLMRGNRCVKMKSSGLDAFHSPNYPLLARADIHIELYESRLLPLPEQSETFICPDFDPRHVAIVPIYPGIDGEFISLVTCKPNLKGLILHSYGVGNIPDTDRSLMDALRKAANAGITLVNVTQCEYGQVHQDAYAAGSELNEIGVVSGSDITLEAAFAKLHLLCSLPLDSKQRAEQMAVPLVGEMMQ